MDYGKMTDHNGKDVDFRNVILIMTTNAGAADMARPAMGFVQEATSGDGSDEINRLFTPEFRNRLDSVITFRNLSREIIDQVVDKFVMELEAQLADRHVTIDLSEDARRWLGEHGYDDLYGARPLGRVIQQYIKQPLAEELLFGQLTKGGVVRVTIDPETDKPTFSFHDTGGTGTKGKTGGGKPDSEGEAGDDSGTGDESGQDSTPELVD
jgi:ATP-dependent Clp protease ATP-binding subunit ClpA